MKVCHPHPLCFGPNEVFVPRNRVPPLKGEAGFRSPFFVERLNSSKGMEAFLSRNGTSVFCLPLEGRHAIARLKAEAERVGVIRL